VARPSWLPGRCAHQRGSVLGANSDMTSRRICEILPVHRQLPTSENGYRGDREARSNPCADVSRELRRPDRSAERCLEEDRLGYRVSETLEVRTKVLQDDRSLRSPETATRLASSIKRLEAIFVRVAIRLEPA
jgi:hypothetical protein